MPVNYRTIVTTSRRESARDAAEEVCRKLRRDIAQHGAITTDLLDYLDRWMRLSGNGSKYALPKPVRKRKSIVKP